MNKHPLTNDDPKNRPIPHDPRNEPRPNMKEDKRERPLEKREEVARREEGVDMKEQRNDRSSKINEDEAVLNTPDDGLPTGGDQTGQTTRGSYSTDTSTVGGRYANLRAGKFGTSSMAQPSNDERIEPDSIGPKY